LLLQAAELVIQRHPVAIAGGRHLDGGPQLAGETGASTWTADGAMAGTRVATRKSFNEFTTPPADTSDQNRTTATWTPDEMIENLVYPMVIMAVFVRLLHGLRIAHSRPYSKGGMNG